eukprot:TRINITY_DN20461_c0_g1_i1.p2 TRINITY_DN20461_c0_g1~~TRINITY_DN20461_c0_g1_i1.p2  ORF type:complete len:356 (+),score=93.05 TRINITY_DN20461_c0_g1_i1:109-1176(+)
MGKRKVIIDLDGSADNLIALMLALHTEDVDVAAVTCVWGEASVEVTAGEVCRVLDHFDIPTPVYLGATEQLIKDRRDKGSADAADVHPAPLPARVSSEHASVAMARLLSGAAKGGATWQIIALGPLTNIALALRINPGLLGAVSQDADVPGFVVMGGALEAKGNSGMASEFNWHSDPEASLVVVQGVGRKEPFATPPMCLVPWEVTLAAPFRKEHMDVLLGLSDARGDALPTAPTLTFTEARQRKVLQELLRTISHDGKQFSSPFACECLLPGACAAATALDHSAFAKTTQEVYVTVETAGPQTRGCCLIDWYGTAASRRKLKRWINARIVKTTDRDALLWRLFRMIDEPCGFRR